MKSKEASDLKHWFDAEQEVSAKTHLRSLRRLAVEIIREKRLLIGGMTVLMISTVAAIAEPRVLGFFVDDVLVPKHVHALPKWVALYLGLQVLRVVTVFAHAMLFTKLGQNVMQALRVRLLERLLSLPVSDFQGQPVGRLVTRVTNDVASLSDMFSAGLISIFGNLVFVLGILVGLLLLNVKLGLMTLVLMPFLAASTYYFSERLHRAYRYSRSRLSALNSFLAESILGMKIVQLFQRERRHTERYHALNAEYTGALVGTVQVFALFQPAITLFTGLAMTLSIVFGAQAVFRGEIAVGVLVAFFSYIQALFQPIRELADKWTVVLAGLASSERIFEILDRKPEKVPSSTRAALDAGSNAYAFKGHIRFENVWFSYRADGNWALHDFTGEILPGQRIGIVGETGAGKSTLIQLLMRFYEPTRGRILVDGVDIREYDLKRYRRSLGLVSQDVMLFSGTIRDNVTLWEDSNAVFDFESRMKGLSDRAVSERGTNLSMGERQWIAFHRASYLNPSVWILDEATANIDVSTEAELERWFDVGSEGKTSLLIAHRLSTLKRADKIWVFSHGVCVEQGSHSELSRLNGYFAKFQRYQAFSEKRVL